MSGYTPVFGSVFTGTLSGKYPDTAAWLFFLALADKHGVVDMTPQYISNVTGMPLEELLGCIERFMQPDPHSRSNAEEGRRLVLVDESRPWGWRIVNHGKYRERARLQAKNAEAVGTGREAERKRQARLSAAVRRCPPLSDPSDTDTDTDTDAKKDSARARDDESPVDGLDTQAWERWLAYRKQIRRPLKPASIPAAQRALAAYGVDQAAVVEQSIANGWQGLFALKTPVTARPVSKFERAKQALGETHDEGFG